MVFAFLQPATARNVLLILLGVGYFGYHALHWWRRRPKGEEKKVKEKEKVKVEQHGARTPSAPPTPQRNGSDAKRHVHSTPAPDTSVPSSSDNATGEELFDQARALPHQVVPDFDSDGPYLDLLGASAAKGYAPALAKLGEYAMRRAAWVEAYYWMKLAHRNGMHGLSPTLREIRKNWFLDGFPRQLSNVNQLFTLEAGSVGRALLHVDSGIETAMAREFLKANYPEFLN